MRWDRCNDSRSKLYAVELTFLTFQQAVLSIIEAWSPIGISRTNVNRRYFHPPAASPGDAGLVSTFPGPDRRSLRNSQPEAETGIHELKLLSPRSLLPEALVVLILITLDAMS